ncbi:hypothetical protein B0H21DRAFT_690079, partial [Amylocystis lapponica]
NDFIFPAIASTGQMKFDKVTSRLGFKSQLDAVVRHSGVMDGHHSKFTTHCFHHNGAQYQFMWANHKWSLKAVKWWGGWSSNENISLRLGVIDAF